MKTLQMIPWVMALATSLVAQDPVRGEGDRPLLDAANSEAIARMVGQGATVPRRPLTTATFGFRGERIDAEFDGREIRIRIDGAEADPARLQGPRRAADGRVLTPAVTLLDAEGQPLAQFTAGSTAIGVNFMAAPDQPWLGLDVGPLDASYAKHIRQLEQSPDTASRVDAVHPDSPAAQAGLQRGDILTQIDGTEGAAPDEIRAAVRKRRPGERIALGGLRAGEAFAVEIEVGSVPGGGTRSFALPPTSSSLAQMFLQQRGFGTRDGVLPVGDVGLMLGQRPQRGQSDTADGLAARIEKLTAAIERLEARLAERDRESSRGR